MASQSELALVVSVIDQATAELRRIASEMDTTGKAAEKSGEGSSLKWTEFKSALDTVTMALGKVKQAAQQLVEFAMLGAQAEMTEQNFARMGDRLGLTADYMQRLREVSGGTIDDLKLMQGVSVLVAGTTGDLESALAGAYPQLLNYAKAAAMLNPQLGDVDYMLNSIATGIKRGSPLILDNLGLTIKVEEANKAYAEALGKSVEELTAEEQKMALLNDVMRAGAVLIDQVGGKTEGLTDAFGRAKTATANYKTELSKAWHEMLAASGAMDALADSMSAATLSMQLNKAIAEVRDLGLQTGHVKDAVVEYWRAVDEMRTTEKDRYDLLVLLNAELERHATQIENEESRYVRLAAAAEEARQAQVGLKIAYDAQAVTIGEMETRDKVLIADMKAITREADAAAEAIGRNAKALELAASFSKELTTKGGLDDLVRQHGRLVTVAASTTEEHEGATLAMLEANEAAAKLAEAEKKLAENSDPEKQNELQIAVLRARNALREATGEADALNAELTEGYSYTTNLSGKLDRELTRSLYKAAEAAGADAGELALLALATGDYTEAQINAALETAAMQEKIELLGKAIAEDKISISEAKEEIIKFREELLGVPAETTVAVVLDEDKLEAAENALDRIRTKLEAIGNTPWTATVTIEEMSRGEMQHYAIGP